MTRQNDLCIVARISGETWYILVTFDSALPGEIDGLRATTDNPGRNTISLKAFRKLTRVSDSAKRDVNNEVRRIKRGKSKEPPIVKGRWGLRLLRKYKISPGLLEVTRTKTKTK